MCMCVLTFLITRTATRTAVGSNRVRVSERGNWERGKEGRRGQGSMLAKCIIDPVLTSSSMKSNSRAHKYIWVWKLV